MIPGDYAGGGICGGIARGYIGDEHARRWELWRGGIKYSLVPAVGGFKKSFGGIPGDFAFGGISPAISHVVICGMWKGRCQ